MRLIFDIETNGLLDKEDLKIHCIGIHDLDNGWYKVYDNRTNLIDTAILLLNRADTLIGHNIIGFDLPVLQKVDAGLFEVFKLTDQRIIDTLVLSRLVFANLKERDFKSYKKKVGWVTRHPNLIGSHSLKAWGLRMGVLKGDYAESTDWAEWTPEMSQYCEQDVRVTTALFTNMKRIKYSKDAIELEHSIARVCTQQEREGFSFDTIGAVALYGELCAERAQLEDELRVEFGEWWTDKGEVTPKRTLSFKDKGRGSFIEGQAYTRVVHTTFNANSREHIAKRLTDLYGWEPTVFTDNGAPKVDETVLGSLDYPHAKLLSKYLMIQKRIGQLAEGSQAWMKLERGGKIHGRVNTMGAVTSRCTHSNPNVAQVPSVSAPYGKECRSLFHAPPNSLLVGVDVSGLELRCLAHYMHKFDEGKYAHELLEGDIHTVNQLAAGLESRSQAKTFIYGFLYGAGPEKLGEIVGGGKKEGSRLRSRFLKKTPAIKQLREEVVSKVKENGWLWGLDGRRIPIRSEHAALNFLLQSAGAIICKRWLVILHEQLKEEGIEGVKQVAFVHDEVQLVVQGGQGKAEQVGKVAIKAIEMTGTYYGIKLPLTGEYNIGKNWADTH
jgi:DNA polymerase I-like protein with 3'-5' exonuclease and polymerase domains